MANRLIDNPLVIDTPSNTVLLTGRRKIIQCELEGYLNATDAVEVQTEDGNTIWYDDGRVDLDTVRSGRIGWVKGIKVPLVMTNGNPNLNTGRLMIYFE